MHVHTHRCELKPRAPEAQGYEDMSGTLEHLAELPEGKGRGTASSEEESPTELLQPQHFYLCIHVCLNACVLVALYASPSQISTPSSINLTAYQKPLPGCLPSRSNSTNPW